MSTLAAALFRANKAADCAAGHVFCRRSLPRSSLLWACPRLHRRAGEMDAEEAKRRRENDLPLLGICCRATYPYMFPAARESCSETQRVSVIKQWLHRTLCRMRGKPVLCSRPAVSDNTSAAGSSEGQSQLKGQSTKLHQLALG